MARVITIAQQKGGAGKTTLAAHLTVAWAAAARVAAIDIDPQGSLSQWVALRRERRGEALGFTHSRLAGWRLADEVDRLARSHDILVIDSPPHAETEAKIAVRVASLVVVPLQPSPIDVWATRPTLELARLERRPVLLVLNRLPSRARLTAEMAQGAAGYGVAVAQAALGNRVAFAASMALGQGVTEAEPDSAAAQEIAALAREILERASAPG
jgi:chromosome partitioning protein